MKLRIATLVFPLALVCSTGFADTNNTMNSNNAAASNQSSNQANNQSNSVLLSSILQELQANGFNTIKSVALDDGVYHVDAFDAGGEEVTVKVNPETGAILNKDDIKTKYKITLQQAASAVENAGYMKIKSIECDDEYFSVEALDKNGDDVDLEVNRSTGAVSED